MLHTPVLFIVFNRPDATAQVFEAIRKVKPVKFFVAADGPRLGITGEAERCEEVRRIATTVDWDCELKTLFHPANLGCGKGVKTAIDWFFGMESKGIILEDDTVPNILFFSYMSEMLNIYENNHSIAHISGSCFIKKKSSNELIYNFSQYPLIWGWATWANRWNKYYEYDLSTHNYTEVINVLEKRFSNPTEFGYWNQIFKDLVISLKDPNINGHTWDYQWLFACWQHNLIAINPSVNLVMNIGYGKDATHTKTKSNVLNQPSGYFNEIKHPEEIVVNVKIDKHIFKIYFNPPGSLAIRVRNIAYRIIPKKVLDKYRALKKYLMM